MPQIKHHILLSVQSPCVTIRDPLPFSSEMYLKLYDQSSSYMLYQYLAGCGDDGRTVKDVRGLETTYRLMKRFPLPLPHPYPHSICLSTATYICSSGLCCVFVSEQATSTLQHTHTCVHSRAHHTHTITIALYHINILVESIVSS